MANNDPNNHKEIDPVSGVETTGHEWDGLKELNTPAPRWWLWVWFVTIVFSVGYWFVYPTWPTLSGHTAGTKDWTEYRELQEHQGEITTMRAKYEARFADASLDDIQKDPELYAYAVAGGAAAFKNNCAACHGSGAQGGKGFPNLNDDEWIWGGTLEQIYASISYGARNENPQSHSGNMPAWKEQLTSDEIENVATYVGNMHLGDKADKTAAYQKGQEVFANNCAACHGEQGQGNPEVGAPQLNNDIWLYGGDHATIVQTVNYGRGGVMPVWQGRLSDSTIKQLTVYVHSLGGGQ